jgi:xanthine phosphoribosyltransferase
VGVRALVERIRREGKDLGGGILKVDGFLNHQLDPELTRAMGMAFKERFVAQGIGRVDRVLTAEVSGIAPALTTGIAFGVPVVYARKRRPITMPDTVLETRAPSHTKGGVTRLIVSPEYLGHGDRVLIIDDFLATGRTLEALAGLVAASGAELCGIGCVIEKAFEGGRARLDHLGVPLITLAVITAMDGEIELAEP